MYSSFYLTVMTGAEKKTRYRASGTRSLFPTPIITYFKYIGPEAHSPNVLAWFVVLVLENRRIECDVARGFHNIQLKQSDTLLRAIL